MSEDASHVSPWFYINPVILRFRDKELEQRFRLHYAAQRAGFDAYAAASCCLGSIYLCTRVLQQMHSQEQPVLLHHYVAIAINILHAGAPAFYLLAVGKQRYASTRTMFIVGLLAIRVLLWVVFGPQDGNVEEASRGLFLRAQVFGQFATTVGMPVYYAMIIAQFFPIWVFFTVMSTHMLLQQGGTCDALAAVTIDVDGGACRAMLGHFSSAANFLHQSAEFMLLPFFPFTLELARDPCRAMCLAFNVYVPALIMLIMYLGELRQRVAFLTNRALRPALRPSQQLLPPQFWFLITYAILLLWTEMVRWTNGMANAAAGWDGRS